MTDLRLQIRVVPAIADIPAAAWDACAGAAPQNPSAVGLERTIPPSDAAKAADSHANARIGTGIADLSRRGGRNQGGSG